MEDIHKAKEIYNDIIKGRPEYYKAYYLLAEL